MDLLLPLPSHERGSSPRVDQFCMIIPVLYVHARNNMSHFQATADEHFGNASTNTAMGCHLYG